MGMLDAFGRMIGAGPRAKLSSLVDPLRKVFEGKVDVKFYNDRATADGYCWHCKSKVHVQLMLTRAQGRAIEHDDQFRKNCWDLLADKLQSDHQCGLLYDGLDNIEDLNKELARERRSH